MTFLEEKDTPEYPRELGKDVASFRKLAMKTGGLSEMSRMARRGYGAAVEEAIRRKQRAELMRELPSHNVRCASGTNYNNGADIEKAIQAQHRAASLAKGRFDQKEADAKYAQAMLEKHGANSAGLETIQFRKAA